MKTPLSARTVRFGLLSKSLCAALVIGAMTNFVHADDTKPEAPKSEVAKPKEKPVRTSHIVWTEDFEAAKAQAAKEGKDMLLDFTGSDWCHWCIVLREEVFDKAEFDAAMKDFVFVELDYPSEKKLEPKIKDQNDGLQKLFGIDHYPTIILADAQGRPYAETGYEQGGPANYLKSLAQFKTTKAKRDEAWKRAESASGLEKAKLLSVGLKSVSESLIPVHYKSVVAEVIKLDPKDVTGVAATFGFKIELIDLFAKYKPGDEKVVGSEVRASVDKFLANHPNATASQKQEIFMGLVNFYHPGKDDEVVAKLMAEVVKLDAESDNGKIAASILKQIEAQKKLNQKEPK